MADSVDSLVSDAADDDTASLKNLRAAKRKYTEQLVELAQDPRPTYDIDGEKVNWEQYQAFLTKQVEKLSALINAMEPDEAISMGFT